MSIKKHIFSENIIEIKSLISNKFKRDLKNKFGHSNFLFNVKNIKISKFKRVFASAVLDERRIEEKREINYSGLSESRVKHNSDINIFSYKRENCVLENVNKVVEYRVDQTNQTETCGTCSGMKQITCSTCRGSGKNRCGTCNGQRQVKCSNCNGRGEVNCNMIWGCGGKGYTTSNENGRNVQKTCSSCNGRGKDPCSSCVNGYNTCSTCNGNGEVSCYSCQSSGKVDCYSCDARGSFTRFLSVNSVLIKKNNSLVIEGNNPGDYISKELISEKYSFEDDFIKYQITSLSDYKPQLKELFSGLLPNKMQEGKMMYASLDECASLNFEILVGESTYLGFLKDGEIWFDDSVMNLLFYDIIDGMKVDSSFSKIIKNKSAFEGSLSKTDIIWKLINQYNKFETLISSSNSVSNKISDARKFNLLKPDKYLESLYPKFIKREFFQKLTVTIIYIVGLSLIYGADGGLQFLGYADFVFIPLMSFVIAVSSSILIKNWSPNSVTVLGFILLFSGMGLATVNLDDRSYEFQNYLHNKEQNQIKYDLNLSNIKNFQSFKKNKLIISNSDFSDMNSSFYPTNDSIIIVSPTEDLKYSFFIDSGVNYKWIANTHCSSCGSYCYGHDKITDDRMGLNIGYNSFIDNSGYYSKYVVRIGGAGGFSDYEVSPSDIKFDVSRYGVTIMKNTLYDYENNILDDVYLSPEYFLKIFPDSDLVRQNMNKYNYFNSNGKMETTYIKPKIILNDNLSNKIYATSNVSNLNIRSTPALSDNIIDMLQLGDRVEVLDTIRIDIKNIKQALLNKDKFIEVEGTRILFKKGKAFEIIDEWPDETVSILVDERNNEAIISKKSLDLIDKEIWIKIRLANQQEGYVYQRFLTRLILDDEDYSDDDEEFFMVVENMPEFPGGDLGLMKYIQKNVKYPAIAKEYNITGKVYVSFIVDKKGSVTNVKIVRGVDKNLDAEAMRVVKSLPKYKPGKQRGKSVRVMFTIPINFTLN